MRTIHKYQVELLEGPFTLALPDDATVCHAEYIISQRKISLWVEVDAEVFIHSDKRVDRNFHTYLTGQGIADSAKYVTTCIDQYTQEAYHVYEL